MFDNEKSVLSIWFTINKWKSESVPLVKEVLKFWISYFVHFVLHASLFLSLTFSLFESSHYNLCFPWNSYLDKIEPFIWFD